MEQRYHVSVAGKKGSRALNVAVCKARRLSTGQWQWKIRASPMSLAHTLTYVTRALRQVRKPSTLTEVSRGPPQAVQANVWK